MNPLTGETVALTTRNTGAAVCSLQLERFGAKRTEDRSLASVVLTDPEGGVRDPAAPGAVVCVFEDDRLLFGGLVASETTAQAALSLPDYVGAWSGRPDRTGADIASSVTGFLAAGAIMAQLTSAPEDSPPVVLRTSLLRALATLKGLTFAARACPDSWQGTHVVSREKSRDCGYLTADGRITLDFPEQGEHGWLAFVSEIGLPERSIRELRTNWYQTVGWGDDVDSARPVYEDRLRRLSTEAAIEMIRRCGGSSVPFLTPEECLAHPQAEAVGLRESFERGAPCRLSRPAHGSALRRRVRGRPGLPLSGVRVVDFGIGGVGPFAPMLLAYLGADVVKIEPPVDFAHSIGPKTDGISTTYLACNNGKRSIEIDLKRDEDREMVWRLVAGADVVNENFRPGVMDRLGFGFDAVAEANPTVVYSSASGYGWAGPLALEPCTDPHAQAFAGFAALNEDSDGAPRRLRYIGFIDLVTSTVIAEGICAALLLTSRTGGPIRTETSMLHAVLEATRPSTNEPGAPDGLFKAADEYVALTCRDDADWERLLSVAGRPQLLTGAEFKTVEGRRDNRALLNDALDCVFAPRAALAWVLDLGRAGVPCTRLIHDDELLARVDYWKRGLIVELPYKDRRLATGGAPIRFREPPPLLRPPLPGEHSDAFRADPDHFWRAPSPSDGGEPPSITRRSKARSR